MIILASMVQRKMMAFIVDYSAEHGYPPSYAEIMAQTDYTSTSTVAHHINILEARGLVSRRKDTPRTLTVTPRGEQVIKTGRVEA